MVSGLKADYTEGVAEVQGKLTTILNLDEIFSSTDEDSFEEVISVSDGQNESERIQPVPVG